LAFKARLRTPEAEVAAFVVVDLGTRAPLLIHERTARILAIDGQGPVDVVVDDSDVVLGNLDGVARALEPLEELTREHAEALGDLPAVAVLGLPAFGGRTVVLDVHGGELRSVPPGSSTVSRGGGPNAKETTLSYTAKAYGYWLEAEAPGGKTLRTRFSTSEFDTRIGSDMAEQLGAPGGDLPRLMLGDVDIMRYAVLRPSNVTRFPDPKPQVILGTGLLSHFVVTLRPDRREITLRTLREPQLALEERAMFVARSRSDAQGVESFLAKHPDSRLADEASEALLAFRLDTRPPKPEAIQRAMQYRAAAARPERRARLMVRIADEMIALEDDRQDAYDLALMALDVGKPFAADDLDDTAIHHINARRGLVALLREDPTQARRYLLSAAFGLPKDPYVNLWLGRLYETTGQPIRAWSRYVEAALRDDPPIGALRGLDRFNQDEKFRGQFSMADAGRLLEGRLPVFMPARQYGPGADRSAVPVRLVELFIDINEPATQAAEMAIDALRAYLEVTGTVFVQYHLGDLLATDAAEARAAHYGVERTPVAVFDGTARVELGGDDTAAAKVFAEYADRAVAGRQADSAIVIEGRVKWEGDRVRADVSIAKAAGHKGPVLHLFLCERAVMAIGGNGQVLHHDVARSQLAPERGWPVTPARTTFNAELTVTDLRAQLNRRLDDVERKRGDRLAMRSTWIDPALCDVIAILHEVKSRRVLAAAVLPREQGEDRH